MGRFTVSWGRRRVSRGEDVGEEGGQADLVEVGGHEEVLQGGLKLYPDLLLQGSHAGRLVEGGREGGRE